MTYEELDLASQKLWKIIQKCTVEDEMSGYHRQLMKEYWKLKARMELYETQAKKVAWRIRGLGMPHDL